MQKDIKVFSADLCATEYNTRCEIKTNNIGTIIDNCEDYKVTVLASNIDLSTVDCLNFESTDSDDYRIQLYNRVGAGSYTLIHDVDMRGTYYNPEIFMKKLTVGLGLKYQFDFQEDDSILMKSFGSGKDGITPPGTPPVITHRMTFSPKLLHYFRGFDAVDYDIDAVNGKTYLNVGKMPLRTTSQNKNFFYTWRRVYLLTNMPIVDSIIYDSRKQTRTDELALAILNINANDQESSRNLLYVADTLRYISMQNNIPLNNIAVRAEIQHTNGVKKTIILEPDAVFSFTLQFLEK